MTYFIIYINNKTNININLFLSIANSVEKDSNNLSDFC